jgi:epoxyqueuosine reductase
MDAKSLSYMEPLEVRLKAEAERLGFADCRITHAGAIPDAAGRLRAWLEAGSHGEMEWMEARASERGTPKTLWSDVRSIVMLGMNYAPATDPMTLAEQPAFGRISAYAQGQDYHDVVKKALKALGRWLGEETGEPLKVFVDTAPVMEKPLAAAAGLGWQGKHTNLVSRKAGSWLFLGAIYTAFDLEADAPEKDRCGSCDACQRICPTDAFPAPYRLDARRCISYLTIEHKGPIPEDLRPGIGNHVYGCDDCLAVCPWNKFAEAANAHRAFLPRAELAAPRIADLLALDDAAFRAVFAGSPIKRIGRNRMVRNAAIAAGNSGDPVFIPALQKLAQDDDQVVAEAATWALARLTATA